MKNYFDISEFLVDPNMTEVPVHVVQKIDKYHKPILNKIRHELGIPVIISDHSGYRSVEWEHSRGRSGNSQHTFKGNGAVDLTCNPKHLKELLELLKRSDYNRVCYYPYNNFIHCDHADAPNKQYFEATRSGKWVFKGNR